jgi:hypothetical protein
MGGGLGLLSERSLRNFAISPYQPASDCLDGFKNGAGAAGWVVGAVAGTFEQSGLGLRHSECVTQIQLSAIDAWWRAANQRVEPMEEANIAATSS